MADINLLDLIDRYNCDDKCRDTLELLRWPTGVCCTRCGDMDVIELENQNRWQCRGCRYQFSVTSGTIMHDSHLPLRKWFLAIYLMCESKKGMSANQLHRTLGVAYRTAWYLCHRIREAMGNDPLSGPTLVGIIEVDETYIGGKRKGSRARLRRQQDSSWPARSSAAARSAWSAIAQRQDGDAARLHRAQRQGRGRGDLHGRVEVLHGHRRRRSAP